MEVVRCPNCSQIVESVPISCPRCGYRSELAREYLWIYASGTVVMVIGFALGASSLLVQDSPPDHWSQPFRDWFPLMSWSREYHWIGFLLAGILWTLAGMGITRHRWDAWGLGTILVLWELAHAGLVAAEGLSPTLGVFIAVNGVLLASLARTARALKRTPPRDIRKLQEGTRPGSP